MPNKVSNGNSGHVSITGGNGTGDFINPVTLGDNDLLEDQGSYTISTYPIVIITVHEKGTVYTYQLNAEQIDVFLTNTQKKALIKKIKLAKMVEKL
jgi:hypothetical protein